MQRFFERLKAACLYWNPCGHHLGIEERGEKKTGDGGRVLPIRLARFDFPQLFDVFLNMAVTRAERFGHSKKTLAYVAGVKRRRGNLGARERVGRAREKGKERLQGRHCFLRFSRSD